MNITEIERLEKEIFKEKDELMRDERIIHHVESTNKRLHLIKIRKELIKILEDNLRNLKK